MAFIEKGKTVGAVNVGFTDPRSIIVKAKATPTTLVLHSDSGLELEIECPAFDTKYLRKDQIVDRFPMGQNLTATIYGDNDSFVRIDS